MGEINDGTSNTLALSETRLPQANHGSANNNTASLTAGMYASATGENYQGDPSQCLRHLGPNNRILDTVGEIGGIRGVHWAWGTVVASGFNTILPPNSMKCTDSNSEWGWNKVMPPDSHHPGGVNVSMADGSVHFISQTINAGSPAFPCVDSGPSPYGVWGALGTRSGGDAARLD
jgi:prepilin-type processing-associated H-X9-DG protein